MSEFVMEAGDRQPERTRCDALLHMMPLVDKNAGKPCAECVALAELAGL